MKITKNTKKLISIVLLAGISLTSCSKKSEDTTNSNITWKHLNNSSIELPFDEKNGPFDYDANPPTQYSNSETGAAIAAIQALVRVTITADNNWQNTFNKLIVVGDTRDILSWSRIDSKIVPTENTGKTTILGYKINKCNHTDCNLNVASAKNNNGNIIITSSPVKMVWNGNTWLYSPAKLKIVKKTITDPKTNKKIVKEVVELADPNSPKPKQITTNDLKDQNQKWVILRNDV